MNVSVGSDPAKVLMSIMLPLMPQLRACFARCEIFGRGPGAVERHDSACASHKVEESQKQLSTDPASSYPSGR